MKLSVLDLSVCFSFHAFAGERGGKEWQVRTEMEEEDRRITEKEMVYLTDIEKTDIFPVSAT